VAEDLAAGCPWICDWAAQGWLLGGDGSPKIACMNVRINCYGSGMMKGMETQDVDLGCNDDSVK
jgi:hypothetical protein